MNENQQSDPASDAEVFVARLEALFESNGAAEYLGEPVAVVEHMLQGAAVAERKGLSVTVIVAALLHDIGHLESPRGTFSMDDAHDRVHEDAGADFLRPYLPAAVVDCVRLHVAVKRYLCATRPDYLRCLSGASIYSLQLQGGPMREDEVAAFARESILEAILQVMVSGRFWQTARYARTDCAALLTLGKADGQSTYAERAGCRQLMK